MILNETYSLASGVEIPKLGLGTWFIDDEQAPETVRAAIGIGYRNIDTAQAYGNERGVGEGVRTSGVPREQLFVSTKLAAEIKDHGEAVAAIDESLAKLGIEYIDLMLIHSPQPWADFRGGDYFEGNLAAWRALEEAHRDGRIRSIGVSNFLQHDLDNILENGTLVPQVNQILLHAGNTPTDLVSYCESRGILVQAYSPIAHGALLGRPRITAIAEKYGASVPQLCIRYALQLGAQPLPKTANPEHMRANTEVDFEISAEDMETLRTLDEREDDEHSGFPAFSGK